MAEIQGGLREADAKKQKKAKLVREVRDWVRTLVTAGAIALFITTLIAAPVRVEGTSMMNTLHDNDFMIVTKFEYLLGDPQRFDVVTCHYPDRGMTSFVKRIVGIPGDTVAIHDGLLYVNGEAVDEPYITNRPNYEMEEVTVDEGCYFVLGDNRPSSNDSHYVGQLTRGQITGKVRCVAWPLSDMRAVQ